MCMPFKAPTPPVLPPVPATPSPAAVFGQSTTLSAAESTTQAGTAPRATSAGSLYIPTSGS